MRIYVRPLSREVTRKDLHSLFSAYGRIESAEIPVHEPTGDPLGFGFVFMPSRTEASVAIKALQGRKLKGAHLDVREARPSERSNGHKDTGRVRGRRSC